METVTETAVNLDSIVERYIALRDKKSALKAKYDADVAEIERALTKCENFFLARMRELGLESINTAAGTAYRSTRTSARVADWDSFLGHVRATGSWSMLEKRAAKGAIEEYRNENDDLPPGIDWREEVTVNVRRS